MKKKTKILIGCGIGLVVVALLIYLFAVPKKLTINDITDKLQTVADGTYCGECTNGIVMAEVELKVKDHTISEITILKHRNGKGQAAESITSDVVDAQSLDVDTVSGATFSSYTILKAIENAILK